jgi:uncharacterized metal-binding protein
MMFALSHPGIDVSLSTPFEVSEEFFFPLQTYRDQEARWQPLRYTWIKFLMLPTRR